MYIVLHTSVYYSYMYQVNLNLQRKVCLEAIKSVESQNYLISCCVQMMMTSHLILEWVLSLSPSPRLGSNVSTSP